MKLFHLLAATFFLPMSSFADAPILTEEEVKNGFHEHAVLAQFHRWFLLYENNDATLENQLNILAEDVTVKSSLGEATGHKAYAERVAKIPKTWKNAHRVKTASVSRDSDGKLALSAEVDYTNVGVLPEGAVRSAALIYKGSLKEGENELPKFTQITISPDESAAGKESIKWSDAYPENRLKSLIHQWLYLIEDPARRLEPFKELLADEYVLHFSTTEIKDFAGFEAWFRGPASSVSASTHVISDFSYKKLEKNQYSLSVTFDWQGILPSGHEMTAKTQHEWLVEDDPTERFARIREVKVKVLKPFAPLERGSN